MLASELARDLQIDVSVMSKRLKTYRRLTEQTTHSTILDDKTVADMRRADELLYAGTVRNATEAMEVVLGLHAEPIPSRSAHELLQRMTRLEDRQAKQEELMSKIAEYLRESLRGRQGHSPASTDKE